MCGVGCPHLDFFFLETRPENDLHIRILAVPRKLSLFRRTASRVGRVQVPPVIDRATGPRFWSVLRASKVDW